MGSGEVDQLSEGTSTAGVERLGQRLAEVSIVCAVVHATEAK